MNDPSADRIRRYLDDNGGTAEVPFHNLMTSWNLDSPSAEGSHRIQEALRSSGVETQPGLSGLVPESRVRLTVVAVPRSPWQAPQAPQAQATPSWAAPAPPARHAAVGPRAVDADDAGALAPAIAAVAATLALVSSFLPWVSVFDEGTSLWELADILDVFLALFAIGVVACGVASFARPGAHALRVATLALSAGLLSFVLITPIEFIVSGEGDVSGTQAGEILALLAAAGLAAALAIGILALRPMAPPMPQGRAALVLLAGLAALCLVGVLQPLVALLPVDAGVSAWEANEVADILGTLIDVALVAVAGAAILGLARPQLVAAAFVLGCYVATGSAVGGIEALAAEGDGAGVFVTLFLLAPLATAGAVLVALGSGLLRQGTRQ